MKILIADDEQTMRDYLTTALDWKGNGFELYLAENGEIALTIMKTHPIDLAVLDITMPIRNGIEILEWVQETNYSCVVSLLTCHDEFDFALKALKIGCFDYLLKNEITDEQFQELIHRMSEAASAEARTRQHYAIMQTSAARNQQAEIQSRIHYWLNHSKESPADMAEFFEVNLGFKNTCHNYVLIMIQMEDYQTAVQRYTENDNVHFLTIFDNILSELLTNYTYFILPTEEGKFFVYLSFDKKIALQHIIDEVCRIFNTLNSSSLQIHSQVRYSLPFSNILESYDIYHEMKKLGDLIFYPLSNKILCISDYVSEEASCQNLLKEFELTFSRELQQRNMAQIEICYDFWISKIAETPYNIHHAAFLHLCENCIHDFLSKYGNAQVPISAPAATYKNSRDYKQHLIAVLHPYCIPDDTQDKKNLIKKAILLVQQNYNENIGLEWLAQKLWVNPSYLSRLFSQEVGQSLTVYINQYRIEQAKKMIASSNLKLYEIAEKSGFSSSIVFSSVFKKIAGETPTEYKNRIL